MSYDVKLAQEIKKQARQSRDRSSLYSTGTVVSLAPLTISLEGGEIMATGKCLRVSETVQRLIDPLPACALNGNPHGLVCDHACFPKPLAVGDKILCIGKSVYFAIDRFKEG